MSAIGTAVWSPPSPAIGAITPAVHHWKKPGARKSISSPRSRCALRATPPSCAPCPRDTPTRRCLAAGRRLAVVSAADDPRHALIDLYLPICSATAARPITVGHLGQSLDGFIATHAGESQFVTGEENILHLHRMRALCDAVVVGAGTVAADDPQLTTRHVPGRTRCASSSIRRGGSTEHYRVFSDDAAETLYVCARSLVGPGETPFGRADDRRRGGRRRPASTSPRCCALLRARGCTRVFVEGGGVTVSAFLEANLLDRLHMAIAPLHHRRRPARHSPAAADRPQRLPSAALSRVPHGRRRAVRLRARAADDDDGPARRRQSRA